MIKQIAHIRTGAKDLAETETFYCDVLGLEKGFSFKNTAKKLVFI